MELLPEAELASWAGARGLGPDPRFPRSEALAFVAAPEHWRPWPAPGAAGELAGFLEGLLAAAAPPGAWVVAPQGGRWAFGGGGAPAWSDALDVVARGAGVPAGHRGAARFAPGERGAVLALAAGSLVFGWGVGEDLHLVPEAGGCVLRTSHHGEVVASFPDAAGLARFAEALARLGVPDPDVTSPAA